MTNISSSSALLLERIGALLESELRRQATEFKLQPVQLEMLGFLNRCNRYSDTPAAVAEYLGLTKGTVSQSLQRLEEKGYVVKRQDPQDGRVVRLSLTAKGKKLASHSVFEGVEAFFARQSGNDVATFERLATELLRVLQTGNGLRPFGICSDCRMFQTLGPTKFRCGLTGDDLKSADSEKLCREFEPSA